jgi:4-hydroxy-4-methyl-2-oxoglutarate aldolase
MPETKSISPSDLELLRKYDTPTICNVIELFEIRPRTAGYMDARIRACFPEMPPMVGYATTATFRSAASPRSGDVYSGIQQQIEALQQIPSPQVVVFQDLDSPVQSATFGEVMCATYKAFGCAGMITSGAGRDLDQVRALKFPAFTDGTICSHGYCHTLSINVPVHVGGVAVYPGDLLHGDCNGVTTIPLEHASAIAHACAEFVAAEAVVLDYVKKGDVNPAGYKKARDELVRLVGELGKRVRVRR